MLLDCKCIEYSNNGGPILRVETRVNINYESNAEMSCCLSNKIKDGETF